MTEIETLSPWWRRSVVVTIRARLQAVRMLLWNQASADPIRAAEALIKLEAREARLLGRLCTGRCAERFG